MKFIFVAQLQHVDENFKQVSDQDFTVDSQNLTTTVASITTREIQKIDSPFNDMFMTVDIPEAYRVDARSFIERPFYVDQVEFPSTAARYTLLNSSVRFLPGDIARSNTSVLNMFKMAAYGRPDLVLNVSMAGTITHAGCVLVGVLPPFPAYPGLVSANNRKLVNTILSGPHAFLHANEATSVAIPVPWYCNTDLATTDMELTEGYDNTLDITVTNGNYATLVFMVLNPLQPSTGSSTSLRIIVEACFKNFDLAVPTPRFVTWSAQSGKSMYNPTYEDFDRLAREFHIDQWNHKPLHEKKKSYYKLLKLTPYMGGILSMTAIMLRIGFACLTGEDVGIDDNVVSLPPVPIDHIKRAPDWQPQSGLINGAMHAVSGLLDSATSGLKNIASDAIDVGRGVIRQYTGLHNPNIPQVNTRVITTSTNFVNNTDVPQFFEKLDPYAKYNRVVKEPIFGSNVDEMAITNITTKKQLIGSFKVSTTDNVGALKWVRPISPFQGGSGTPNEDLSVTCYNNLELLHSFSRAWRGTMKLTIQSVMNNKQQCKLKVIKMYNPSVKVTSQYPVYQSVVNAPSHLLEFTQGGQEHEVMLPYLCRNDITPCATNMDTEAVFHGVYYIYVAQPLANSDSSPADVEFNVYLSGEPDLTFYGYTTSTTYHDNYSVLTTPQLQQLANRAGNPIVREPMVSVSRAKPNIAFYKYANNIDATMIPIFALSVNEDNYDYSTWSSERKEDYQLYKRINMPGYKIMLENFNSVRRTLGDKFDQMINTWVYNKQNKCIEVNFKGLKPHEIIALKKVMLIHEIGTFSPQSGSIRVMNEPQEQHHITREDDKEPNLTHMNRLMPTLDIRHFLRRMYKSQTYTDTIEPLSTKNVFIPLSSFIGENPGYWNYTPIETFSRMYYGKSPGFKFRLMTTVFNDQEGIDLDVALLNLRIYYIPQNINALTNSKVVGIAQPNPNSFTTPFDATDGIALPFQIIGKESTKSHVVYEFSVPDTSFYKFMGGPNKFYNFDGNSNPTPLAQGDFGTIVIQYSSLTRVYDLKFSTELFIGLTDETRFGYHTMAPPFKVFKAAGTYAGINTNPATPAVAGLNPFTYQGGFL